MKHIGILIFDGVEELDAVGPWEVLAEWALTFPEDGYRVSFVSPTGGTVEAAKGLTLTPHTSLDDAAQFDVFLHPGGRGTRPLIADPEHLDRMRQIAAVTPLLTSVCTGSLVYAAAGLLRHRPATSHWGSLGALADLDPTIELRPDDRWVDDGDIITSAGVSAGIDMALHLVRRLVSLDRAREVRRGIQYDPQPPI